MQCCKITHKQKIGWTSGFWHRMDWTIYYCLFKTTKWSWTLVFNLDFSSTAYSGWEVQRALVFKLWITSHITDATNIVLWIALCTPRYQERANVIFTNNCGDLRKTYQHRCYVDISRSHSIIVMKHHRITKYKDSQSNWSSYGTKHDCLQYFAWGISPESMNICSNTHFTLVYRGIDVWFAN